MIEQFRTFHIPGLLPEGHSLVLNPLLGVLSELAIPPCTIVAQERLTEHQMYLLVALLEAYPTYATLEALEAALTDEPLTQVQARLNRALEDKTLDQETKIVRNVLLRLKPKLKNFGLTVTSVHRYGYVLVPR